MEMTCHPTAWIPSLFGMGEADRPLQTSNFQSVAKMSGRTIGNATAATAIGLT